MNTHAASSHPREACDVLVLGGGMLGIWIAQRAAARGMRVAIVEIGPGTLAEQREPNPAIDFTARRNLGAVKARNHVLSGNSAYWGGGLVRNSRASLLDVFAGNEQLADAILARYEDVESQFGIAPPVVNGQVGGSTLESLEVAILPGRRRGVWSQFASQVVGNERIRCHTSSTVRELHVANGRVTGVTIQSPKGLTTIEARHVVVSMGVVDSNLFAAQFLHDHLPAEVRDDIGRHLHDHWSVPVAKVRWRNHTPLSSFFPLSRARGGTLDRRLAFEHGYFHFTADFGALPPYDRVKKLMSNRQKGVGLSTTARDALACFGRPLMMGHAVIHYATKHQIFVPDGSEVFLVLDFSANPSPLNRIVGNNGRATFDWDIRPQDVTTFRAVYEQHRQELDAMFRSAGVGVDWMVPADEAGAEKHLRATVVDAYHLGGGLQALVNGRPSVTTPTGQVRGLSNMHVLGTAAFSATGIANPVLTLFAWGDAWLASIEPGVHVKLSTAREPAAAHT